MLVPWPYPEAVWTPNWTPTGSNGTRDTQQKTPKSSQDAGFSKWRGLILSGENGDFESTASAGYAR